MKKVLSFCVLCVFLVMMCVGVKAQTPSCCMTMTPPNLPSPMVANQPDTFYIQPNLACVSGNTKISLEWVVLRNGVQIPDGMLSTYFNDFRFQTLGRVNGTEGWIGESYTSAYCNNGNGYGSYPGANTPIAEEGIPCLFEGPFAITGFNGQKNYYDYFYARFFGDSTVTSHRLIVNPKDGAEYQIILSIYSRVGGTDWDHSVNNAEHASTYIGGHMSRLGSLIMSDTLRPTEWINGADQVICYGDTIWAGNPLVPFYTTGNDTAYYYSTAYTDGSSCNPAIDSIVAFRLDVITLGAPELNIAASNLQICDGGSVTLTAIPAVALDPTICVWFDAANNPLDTTDSYTTDVTATTTFYVYSYDPVHDCMSPTSTPVVVEVYPSTIPFVETTSIDTVCENQDIKLFLDQSYSFATIQWYHNDVLMAGETKDSLIISNAQLSDAGTYKAEVSVDHTHSVYPALSITCTGVATDEIVVNARPELAITDFNGTEMNVVDTAIAEFVCLGGTDSITAAVTNGTAPYVYTWTGVTTNVDAAATTVAYIDNTVCGVVYNASLSVVDANGCLVKQPVSIEYTVNDTTAPVITVNVAEVAADTVGENCQYLIPDVLAGISASDNCAIKSLTQEPVAGDTIVADTKVVVTAVDTCGNISTDTVLVKVNEAMVVSAPVDSIVNVLCPNADPNTGSFVVTIAKGNADYTLTLIDQVTSMIIGTPVTVEESYKFENLAASEYKVVVADANGCEDSVEVEITAPVALTFDVVPTATDASCNSIPDGTVAFSVVGGVAPYTVLFTSEAGTDTLLGNVIDTTITGLTAGMYIVDVTDSNGCNIIDTAEIVQPVVMTVTSLVTNNPICHDDSTGNASIVVDGGTAPYTYTWTKDSLTGDTVSVNANTDANLYAGDYMVRVVDVNGCDVVRSFTLDNPDAMSIYSLALTDLTCPHETDYEFSIVMDAIEPVVTYTWIIGADTVRENTSIINNDTLHYVPATFSCTDNFDLRVVISDTNNCSVDTTASFAIYDTVAPTHVGEFDTLVLYLCSVGSAPAEMTTIAELNAENITFTDNCTAETELAVVCEADTNMSACPYVITRTYKVSDKCGNVDSLSQVITISDTVKPMVIVGLDTIRDGGFVADTFSYADVECHPNLPQDSIYQVDTILAYGIGHINEFISCNINGSVEVIYEVSSDVVNDSTPASGIVYNSTYTVTDLCGNTSVFNSRVLVYDTIKPTVTNIIDTVYYEYATSTGCDNHMLAIFDSVGAVNAHFTNAIKDCNVKDTTPVVLVLADTVNNCPDSIIRTYTVTDAAGNTATFTHTVVIIDTVAPVLALDTLVDTLYETIACAADAAQLSALEANFTDVAAIQAAYVGFSAGDCTDLLDSLVKIDTIIDTIPAMTLTYKYDIYDECGNNSPLTHIVRIFDTIAPVVNNVLADTVMYSTASVCSPDYVPFAALNELEAYIVAHGGVLDITECHLDSATLLHVSTDSVKTTGCELIYVYSYTVADSAGNVSLPFDHILRIFDTVAPVLATTVLPDTNVYLSDTCTYTTFEAVSVSDLDSLFGDTLVTFECNLVDTVTFEDDTLPGVGASHQVRIINRTYTITDSCGNSSNVSQTITILDTIKPVLMSGAIAVDTLPTDTIYSSLTTCDTTGVVYATVADLPAVASISDCSVLPTAILNLDSTNSDGVCPLVVVRYYTVTDTCANTSLPFSHTTVIIDTVAPVIAAGDYLDTLIAYTNGNAGCDFDAPAAYTTLAEMRTANAHLSMPQDCHTLQLDTNFVDHDTVYTGCTEHYFVRTYTIKDTCGNVTSIDQIINVLDTVAPRTDTTFLTDTIAVPRYNNCVFVVPDLESNFKPYFYDNCASNSDLIYIQSPAAGDTIDADTVVKVWLLDACINGTDTLYANSSDTFSVNVTIPVKPVIDTIIVDSVLCAGNNTGAFTVIMIGEESYHMTYLYNPNPNTRSADTLDFTTDTLAVSTLYAGTIEFKVADVYGCMIDSNLTILEPDTMQSFITLLNAALCSADNMILRDTVTGGVAPFTYTWTISEGVTDLFVTPAPVAKIAADTLTYVVEADNAEHSLTYSVNVVDANGCTVSDEYVQVTYPTYHYVDSGRICMGDLPYTDWRRDITSADVTVDNQVYVFSDTLVASNDCDSIHTLKLTVTSNPYLVGRVASTSSAIDGSDLTETIVEYNTNTDTTSQFEFFIRKNCTDCNVKVSLEVDMYVVDEATGLETRMAHVTDYANLSFASYLDNNYTQWTPADASSISIPGHYVSFNGISQRVNYFNLCYADPDYSCNPSTMVTPASQVALSYYGPDYAGVGTTNLGRVHGIKVSSWRQAGTYKFVIRLVRRDDATAYALTNRDWCLENQLGGHGAVLTSTVYDTLTFYVHVAEGTAPISSVDPFESEVNFGVENVGGQAPASIAIAPNPARDQFNVSLNGFSGETSVIIANAYGMFISNTTINVDELSNDMITITTAGWAQGVYNVIVSSASATDSKQVVIVR